MTEKETFDLFVPADNIDGIRPHVLRWSEREPPVKVIEVEDLNRAAADIVVGKGDLIACDAKWLMENPQPGLNVIGALERREPTMVLVGNNKLEYVPKNAIIVTELPLLKRQLLRARSDLVVKNSEELAKDLGSELPEDFISCLQWLNEQIENGNIDGFITTRSNYSAASIRTRRHTLGMQRGDASRQRFVPPPWQGYTMILARPKFPIQCLLEYLDEGNYRSFQLESVLVAGIPPQHQDFIGVNISQRKVATILKEMLDKSEQQLSHELVDINGDIISGKPRIEVVLELVGVNGSSTVSIERVAPMDEATTVMIRKMLIEWEHLMDVTATENPEHPRYGPACPPFITLDEEE
ncbi:MAG TPA: hypothetical protein EYQ53_05380 [Candidatus Poseidoniales archaeon]|jgi:hypothetical protein|nr:hypothetical protein [Candidatus Poseidoniales archaeon]